jgi:arginyl-tRNA synthetase
MWADAARLRADTVGQSGYALAYGSHVHRPTRPDSDLDLLFVGAPLDAGRRQRLTEAVIALHHDHGLRLDTEVAYEVKLHATPAEVEAALRLRGFTVDAAGTLTVAPVVVAPWFLNSPAFKLRLLLNALSSPHVFLGGDVARYRRDGLHADRAVALVALSLLDPSPRITVAAAVNALVGNPDHAAGEDFLGYASGPALHSTVQRGLAHLVPDRVVSPVDGAHFVQDHDRRRRSITDLHGPGSLPASRPGTMNP